MSNALKKPIVQSLANVAKKNIYDAVQLQGREFPCHVVSVVGGIVTVSFDVSTSYTYPSVSIPIFGPEYIRYPIQPGDKGVAISIETSISDVSGLGGGLSPLSNPGNLSSLVFLPVASAAWSSVDGDTLTLYGPGGVLLRDTGNESSVHIQPSSVTIIGKDSVTISSGGAQLSLSSSGSFSLQGSSGSLTTTGGLTMQDSGATTSPTTMASGWAEIVSWLNSHTHTSSNPGSPTSAPITPYTGGGITT